MRIVTLLALVGATLALAPRVEAQACAGTEGEDFQRVTVREINAIPQASIDQLNAASAAGTLDIDQVQDLVTSELLGELVEFTAVVLTDPLKSGLASLNDEGIPGRIHVFVRDTSAASMGVEGMGTQLVDANGDGAIQNFFPGDVITVCGFVNEFELSGGNTTQIAPIAGGLVAADVEAIPTDDPLRQPVAITTDDIHDIVDGQTQIDWDAYANFNGQYVRFEGIEIIQGIQGGRPDVLMSSREQDTQVNLYDTSVCYYNSRGTDYFPVGVTPPECVTNGDFVPPPTGFANVQGFLTYQGDEGGFDYSSPGAANFVINPFEEEDFVVTEAPPTVSVAGPSTIPGPDAPATITATVIPAQGTITSVVADYTFVETEESGQITLTSAGDDTYTGEIPAGPNGSFVSYTVTATDSEGLSTTTDAQGYLVFEGAIDSISLLQETFDGGPGDSPLYTGPGNQADDAVEFDLDAVVQAVFQSGNNYFGILQDDPELGPFTGVWVFFGSTAPDLEAGDRINITEARINEQFAVTQIQDLTYTVTGSGDPYPYKEVTTNLFTGTDGARTGEQHEGMLLSFDDVTVISTNADAPSGPFGEFSFSSDGRAATALRADDYSSGLSFEDNDPGSVYEVGDVLDYIRGPLYFSFSNYKLTPVSSADIGEVIGNTDAAAGPEASQVRIVTTFPNPASSTARVRFELATASVVSLRLYDVTGRQVATLAEGAFAASEHEVSADLGTLAAGVYVLRLEADGGSATARIAVVR